MDIDVDVARCVASGQCVARAPEVFDQDDVDGSVVVLDPSPPVALHRRVREAGDACPTGAIAIQS